MGLDHGSLSAAALRRVPVAIVGAGPAGLAAAEVLAHEGLAVEVFDAMPSAGRKFQLAGRGGLNLTHSEPFEDFVARYGERAAWLGPMLRDFDATALRAWAHGLGQETFVGSSGRVFPVCMKAAPLLRAWLQRLAAGGVRFHMRHRWEGFEGDPGARRLRLRSPEGVVVIEADAVLLALGGGSWSRLGSDGRWVPWLREAGVAVRDLQPANCGFDVAGGWSEVMRRFAGEPLKSVSLSTAGEPPRRGEFVLTATGIEGSLVYSMGASLRDQCLREGGALAWLDLLPDRPAERVLRELAAPRGRRSLSNHLRVRLGLEGVKAALLREVAGAALLSDAARVAELAACIKALPLRLAAPRPLDEAISSAGGVGIEALDDGLMLRTLPGVYCAGEMLDWEAPTGGYLLTACLATGRRAGQAIAARFME